MKNIEEKKKLDLVNYKEGMITSMHVSNNYMNNQINHENYKTISTGRRRKEKSIGKRNKYSCCPPRCAYMVNIGIRALE